MPAAGLVRFQIVLMIAVENLMVGETAYMQLLVDESFVERFVHRLEGDVLALVAEDVGQTLCLLGAVGEDKQLILLQ